MRSTELWNLVSAVLLSVGGAGALIFGLSSWIGKVWANRILEREKLAIQRELHALQAESSQRLHELKERTDILIKNLEAEHSRKHRVHNLQFTKEFELYTLTWKALNDLKIKTLSLHPAEGINEKLSHRVKEFADAWRSATDIIEEHQPFFPKEVYEKVRELAGSSLDEALKWSSDERIDAIDPQFFKEEVENSQKQIASKIDAICVAIQTRIGLIEPISVDARV
ncbi:hypothetical protein [Corallococcus sp. CA054B]|uniref:hypothetical protein n=1 Tax=Corallococcus sp. CA054B TaxID=2316734 RepID=UPI001F371207|nr:hypothetical protein [Corallococcus sp. CA054B]